MTQARTRLPFRVNLTPTPLVQTTPVKSSALDEFDSVSTLINRHQRDKISQCEQIIYPGEPSEILIQLESLEEQTLSIEIQVEGNYPQEWCQLGIEGQILRPGHRIEAVLYYLIDPDFLESQEGWNLTQSTGLDYNGYVHVNYRVLNQTSGDQDAVDPEHSFPSDSHSWFCESIPFKLFIRPRSLYLNFLPDLYREVDFIGRLLKVFEQAFEPAVQTLDNLWASLDPRTAPQDMLPFLAHWVGWPWMSHIQEIQLQASSLPHKRQRQLIWEAMNLYRWRGTKRGLRQYLHLYTNLPLDEGAPASEQHIFIQSYFQRGFLLGETRLGQDSRLGGGRPFHFIVRLRPHHDAVPLSLSLLHTIIQQEKPAFSTYELWVNNQLSLPSVRRQERSMI